jgi:hypothetical protein
MDSILAEVRAKLARLQALEMNPGTDSERDAATAAISRLMLRYNLTRVDIPEDQEDEEFIKDTFDTSEGLDTSDLRWRASLLTVIAKYNFCKAIGNPAWVNGRQKLSDTLFLIGKPANIEVTKALYQSIAGQIESEAQRMSKYAKGNARSFRNSFRLGAVATIQNRFSEQRRTDLDGSTANALAIIPVLEKQLEDATGTFFRNLKSGTRARIEPGAFARGREAGKSLKIQETFNGKRTGLNAGRLSLSA